MKFPFFISNFRIFVSFPCLTATVRTFIGCSKRGMREDNLALIMIQEGKVKTLSIKDDANYKSSVEVLYQVEVFSLDS